MRNSVAHFDARWFAAGEPGAAEERRLADCIDLMPAVDSMLDVGCGAGWLLTRARDKVAGRRVGCDTSAEALRHLADLEAVRCSCAELPFPDRSFELVSCCDVLEHVPDAVERATLRELARVADRFVLLNTPLDEDLGRSAVRCPSCGLLFHADHHRRSYSRDDLRQRLDASFALHGERTSGWTIRSLFRVPPAVGAWADFGWRERLVCPRCGHRDFRHRPFRQLAKRVLVTLNNGITAFRRNHFTRDSELIMLFERVRD